MSETIELREWLKNLIKFLYEKQKMSKIEVKNCFKIAHKEYERVFGENVFILLKDPDLNKKFICTEPNMPPFYVYYYVSQVYKSIVCDVIFGE